MPLVLIQKAGAQTSAVQTSVVRPDPKTGRLVRSVVAPLKPSIKKEEIEQIAETVAAQQGVEAPLVHSVIRAESNFNPGAVSPRGAQGVMQLIPSTAKRFGVDDAFDARQNIEGGVKYLKFLLGYFQGDYTKTIAAYNAGEKAVDKYQGVPPYAETRNYVWQVAKNLKAAREKQPAKTAGTDFMAPVSTETERPIFASVGSDGRIYYRTAGTPPGATP
jgi:soluble lytic murein transglycosylase-like protein